ncbi:MAG: hypothetical protein WEB00_04250 [Dehalococcoidia bacterium]
MRNQQTTIILSAAAAVVVLILIVGGILLLAGDDDGDGGNVENEATATPTSDATDEETPSSGDDDDSTGDDDNTGDDDATPTATAEGPSATALEAVGRFVENDGQNFVGECPGPANPPQNSYCAVEAGPSGNQIAFFVGPVASEFTDEFFVRPEGDGFVVDHIEPMPCGGQIPCSPPIGSTVVIDTSGCVNARSQPTISAGINECVEDGTQATIQAGPTEADARTWYQLEGLGWVSAGFIRCVDECG